MKLASEKTAGLRVPLVSSLDALLARLQSLASEPGFAVQQQMALRLALLPYLEGGSRTLLSPLLQEQELAGLILYADFYPQDGQLTLIEQLRDVITQHIPQEEREWLDPLKHSYLDLAEFLSFDEKDQRLVFRSLGNARMYRVPDGAFRKELQPGQILFTRLIREPGDVVWERAVIAGAAIVLSDEDAKRLLSIASDYRRQVEMSTGFFDLGDWPEFTKRYGHMLLWAFAHLRFAALLDAVGSIRYRTSSGQPYLYAVALYDHHAFEFLDNGLSNLEGFNMESVVYPHDERSGKSAEPVVRGWVQHAEGVENQNAVVVRLTLTTTQLTVECDSPERLDSIKHRLAATFGFSLHFQGESYRLPPRQLAQSELAKNEPVSLVISTEEDKVFMKSILKTVYLEWADRESPSLNGLTPRHAATSPTGRAMVATIIDEMERYDLGLRRWGASAFDYDILRAHVGLERVQQTTEGEGQ